MGTNRKRSSTPGSIYKEKSGRWVAAVSLGVKDESGRPMRRRKYARDYAEAKEALDILQARYRLGAFKPKKGRTPTLRGYLDQWLETREGQLSERTLIRYRQLLAQHVVPALGSQPVNGITDDDVTKLLNQKVKAGLSARSAYHIKEVLRAALNKAVKDGYVVRNPAAGADHPKLPYREMKTLAGLEARELVENSDKTRDGDLFTFLVSSGVRLGEALGLRWGDYNAQAGTLRVTRQLRRRPDGSFSLEDCKTEHSHRTLDLNVTAREAIESQRRRQHKEQLLAGPNWQGQKWDLIFMTDIGRPMDGPALTRRLHRFLAELGLPDVRVHDLRHTWASQQLANGANVVDVSRALGHRNVTTTLNTYAHASLKGQRQLASIMDSVLGR